MKTVAGDSEEPGVEDGPGDRARFDSLVGIASDGEGCLYVADDVRVSKVQLPSAWRATQPGTIPPSSDQQPQAQAPGQQYHIHDNSQVLVSTLPCGFTVGPLCTGVAFDPSSRTLLLRTNQAVYRRSLADGMEEPVLLAGMEGCSGVVDGRGSAARFSRTTGLEVDGGGCVYVLDVDYPRNRTAVRKVLPDGTVSTLISGLEGRLMRPSILPNGYLALCNHAGQQLLVLDLGLTPNACHAAAPGSKAAGDAEPPAAPGPPPYTLAFDLGRLLDRQPDGTADVIVEVGGQAFQAHRTVLFARSEYFHQRLQGGFSDGGSQLLTLPDADPEAFGVVLRYMYTDGLPAAAGELALPLLLSVGELADRLLLPGLCAEVGGRLLECVCAESVVGMLLWAEQRGASYGELLGGLKTWFVEHRREVAKEAPEGVMRLMGSNPTLAFELYHGMGGGV